MSIDITNEHIVKRIIQDIEGEQNRQRREDDFNSYQIMSGNQRQFVEEILKDMFPESHKVMTPSNINVLKKVNDRTAVIYKEAPTRLVNGEVNENLDKIIKEGKFNRTYSIMDKTYNRSRCVLNWIQNDESEKTKFRMVSLPQYTFDLVINNDTLELELVVLSYPDNSITVGDRSTSSDSQNQIIAETDLDSSATSKQYAMWTNEHHVNVRSTTTNKTTVIDFMKDDANPKMENSLGVIPFVWTTTQPDLPEFPTPNPLAKESLTINVMNSTLLTAATKQIGIMVLKYPQGSAINEVHTGFTVALQLPQKTDQDPVIETDAKFIVPSSDLSGMRETFLEYTAGILSDNGLEGATLTGSNQNFSSGLERLIASASITDIRQENIETYRDTEERVFEIIKAYDKVNKTRLFNEDDKLNVIYAKPAPIISEMEKVNLIKAKDELGVLEEKDIFSAIHDDMTEKQIEQKIERIKSEKEKRKEALKNEMLKSGSSEEPEEMEEEEESEEIEE